MQVTVSSRHMGLSDAIKSYCQEKAGRLPRYYDRIQSIEVVLDGKAGVHTAEIIVHTEGTHQPVVATEEHEDLHASIDLLMDKAERQLTKLKEKLRNRKHPPRTGSEPEGAI